MAHVFIPGVYNNTHFEYDTDTTRVSVRNCHFFHCQSTNPGGALSTYSQFFELRHSSFTECASTGSSAGSFHCRSLYATIDHVCASQCTAFSSAPAGHSGIEGSSSNVSFFSMMLCCPDQSLINSKSSISIGGQTAHVQNINGSKCYVYRNVASVDFIPKNGTLKFATFVKSASGFVYGFISLGHDGVEGIVVDNLILVEDECEYLLYFSNAISLMISHMTVRSLDPIPYLFYGGDLPDTTITIIDSVIDIPEDRLKRTLTTIRCNFGTAPIIPALSADFCFGNTKDRQLGRLNRHLFTISFALSV